MPGERPSRAILFPAAVLAQLAGATCILIGTVAFALTFTGGDKALAPLFGGWIIAALSSVICGGLIYRGNLPALILAAGLDAVLGGVLAIMSRRLAGVLHMMSPDDVAFISTLVLVVACVVIVAGFGCMAAIPQARAYATWLAEEAGEGGGGDEELNAAGTARGWTPARASTMPPVTMRLQIKQGKRRLWFALVGIAVGLGSGVGVLIATRTRSAHSSASASPSPAATPTPIAIAKPAVTTTGTGMGTGTGTGDPITTPQDLLVAEHAAIGRGDVAALVALATPSAFAFGPDADAVADGRGAIETILRRELGDAPADGFGVDGKYLQLGEWRDHAWIAEELEITGKGAPRRYLVTQLAAKIDGRWSVVAWHWGMAVSDALAERHAKDHSLPKLGVVPDRNDATDELDGVVKTALGSRAGFAAAFSTRADAFNFGSAGERLANGETIKKLFDHIRADLTLAGGALVVGGNLWDKSQRSGAWIAFAAANVDFEPTGHPIQAFRVLAVLVKDEDDKWQIVQTQFSLGGPIK